MRLSLKDLFAITACCSVFAVYASLAGVANPRFWIALSVSLLAAFIFVRLAASDKIYKAAAVAGLVVFFPGCLILPSVAMLINAGLLIVFGLFCANFGPWPWRKGAAVAIGCTLFSIGLILYSGSARVADLVELRKQFPKISLVERLAYEKHRKSLRDQELPAQGSDVLGELDKFEEVLEGGHTTQNFERLHSEQYKQFLSVADFGVLRMMPLSAAWLERPKLRDIAFDEPVIESVESNYGDWGRSRWEPWPDNSTNVHRASRNDFLHRNSFGKVFGSNRQVAGFVEHAMHHPSANGVENHQNWLIERLELVSLLKFEAPRAYVLDHLPRMDQLSADDIPTRPLDMFEAAALKQLWSKEDIVVENEAGNIRMLGSLRAAKQCLECHDAARGELLGAFSYVLRRAADAPPEAPADEDLFAE